MRWSFRLENDFLHLKFDAYTFKQRTKKRNEHEYAVELQRKYHRCELNWTACKMSTDFRKSHRSYEPIYLYAISSEYAISQWTVYILIQMMMCLCLRLCDWHKGILCWSISTSVVLCMTSEQLSSTLYGCECMCSSLLRPCIRSAFCAVELVSML